jgi:hypothetical protein
VAYPMLSLRSIANAVANPLSFRSVAHSGSYRPDRGRRGCHHPQAEVDVAVSILDALRALRPLKSEQVMAGNEQIRERTSDEEVIGVLRDAAVARDTCSPDRAAEPNRVPRLCIP